jgi:RES domain
VKSGLRAPGPAEAFTVRTLTPQDVGVWHHIYSTQSHPTTDAHTFSQGWGDTRFAPIKQADGSPVHTCYIASSCDAAYMESVLHNVSLSPPGVFEVDTLRYYRLVKLELAPEVRYVSFHTHDLPKLDPAVTRADLIDTLTDRYAQTRAWSQAAFMQCPDAQAIGYGSRRNDSGRCLMLFRQRLPAKPFVVLEEESLALPPRRAEMLALVQSLKVRQV